MEYLMKVKDDKRGKALITRLKALDYVELEETEDEIDEKAFRAMIRKAEKSKPKTLNELKAHIAQWAEKKS